ncbi:hypothetical protein ANO14919_137440 [Xylariales sp. No.14919]|nr:hypothetical protein ANO14919_137440 [Xylariales sp. No.14919]
MQYEALAQQIESVLDDPRPASAQIKDDQLRRRLAESARKLGIFLEEPRHNMRRLRHVVIMRNRPFVFLELALMIDSTFGFPCLSSA